MLGAATHECPADSPSVVVTFANSTTSDGSTTPTTEDATTTAELPVDIQQLLDESERQALELLRTSSEAIRTRLLRREQPQATSPAALKAILEEQTQWLNERGSLELLLRLARSRTGRSVPRAALVLPPRYHRCGGIVALQLRCF